MAKKAGKKDKHGHNFIIFSQATGQTWYHISTHHLSALGILLIVEESISSSTINPAWDRFPTPLSIIRPVSL